MVDLAAGRRRVDPEVGPEAVERRDPGQQAHVEALGRRSPHRFLAWVDEDAGVAVERGTDSVSGPDEREYLVDHGFIRLETRPPRLVEVGQGASSGIELLEERSGDGVGNEVEGVVGVLERETRLRRQVATDVDACADDCQRAGLAATGLPPDDRCASPDDAKGSLVT